MSINTQPVIEDLKAGERVYCITDQAVCSIYPAVAPCPTPFYNTVFQSQGQLLQLITV